MPIHLTLLTRGSVDSKLEFKKQDCEPCRSQRNSCSRILIRNKSRKLVIRRLYPKHDHENGLESWDLACFRYPPHPNFENLEELSRVKYLSMHFETHLSKHVPTHLSDGKD